jgi:hypothetical protein
MPFIRVVARLHCSWRRQNSHRCSKRRTATCLPSGDQPIPPLLRV